MLGSANRKIDIFKITCKVMSCVGAGLIKKILVWYQIPYSTNLKILYQTSCILARWSVSSVDHHILGTQALGLGVKILVNVAVYPAMLSCSRSQTVKIIADRRKLALLAIMLKFIRS